GIGAAPAACAGWAKGSGRWLWGSLESHAACDDSKTRGTALPPRSQAGGDVLSEERWFLDKASVIGSVLGVICCVVVAYMASHGAWSMFYSEKGLIMVFGGTISVIFMAMPMEKIKCVPGY